MVDIRACSADPGLSLADLQTTVRQNEEIGGQLVAMGNSDGKTILNLDVDLDPPDKPATLVRGASGPAGSTLICQGTVFVAGTTLAVSAFRGA